MKTREQLNTDILKVDGEITMNDDWWDEAWQNDGDRPLDSEDENHPDDYF